MRNHSEKRKMRVAVALSSAEVTAGAAVGGECVAAHYRPANSELGHRLALKVTAAAASVSAIKGAFDKLMSVRAIRLEIVRRE